MLALLATITPIVCLTAFGICITVFDYLEEKLKYKSDVIKEMIDKDYETDKVDINKL